MRKKRNVPGFDASEPEFLLRVMDRHPDWCGVVCLVGSGQEINKGEAGLNEWLTALANHFPHWQVHLSDRIASSPDEFGISRLPATMVVERSLHLGTAIRSFRSENVSAFASAIIDGKPTVAVAFSTNLGSFPFQITREVSKARHWLRNHRRGTERAGLLTFSNGTRLKPEGIFAKADIDPIDWFLGNPYDVRSSDYLEDAATEFDVQGLELDWACVCIDANLRLTDQNTLKPFLFRGTRWQEVKDPSRHSYVLNAHRVLLTRARQGTIIFVPRGNADDPTRLPAWYDGLAEYFLRCGVQAYE